MSEININDLIGKSIPPEILDQLKVFNRIQFPLKDTVTSTVSATDSTEQVAEDGINELLNHVKDMEDTCKQIEDSIDLLTKDMDIPPIDDIVSDAAKRLGSPTGNITQEVFKNALSIMDYTPALIGLGDPILGALTGDSSINGDIWLSCDQITSGIASTFKTTKKLNPSIVEPIKEKTLKIMNDFEKKQQNMLIEMLQMLFWNMLWCKYIVDANLNILRSIIANPIDSIILFFKKFPFRKPSKEEVEKNGPINKLINKIRITLICKVPPKAYPRYKPMVDIDCSRMNKCVKPPIHTNSSGSEKLEDIGDITSSVLSDDPCVTADEFFRDNLELKNQNPTSLGASPECIKAAKTVLDAVMSDALSPGDSGVGTFINNTLLQNIGSL